MTNDIIALLYRIKENIKVIESEDLHESLLDDVRADFLELIELIKLFLISERDSYYGYFLMNMQFKANFYSDSIAGIKLNEFPPVFEANPLLLCKFSLKEIIYVVCHEIDHVVLNHPAEMVKSNPECDPDIFQKFNLAADAAVNDRINHEIVAEKHLFMSEPDGVITSPVLSKLFQLGKLPKMESYAYYFNLIRGLGMNKSSMQNGQQSMMSKKNQDSDGGSGSGTQSAAGESGTQSGAAGGGEKAGEGASAAGSGEGTGDGAFAAGGGEKTGEGASAMAGNSAERKKPVTAADCSDHVTDHNWQAGDDPEDAAAVVREYVNAAYNMMSSESRGLMPAYFLSQVEKLNKPPVLSWQAILKKYVGTITANRRKTRMRLNRRQPERFDLSGTMEDKVLKIVVAIDTSGSVSDPMIAEIFNEIFAILAKRKHDITVIECDAKVQRVYKAKRPADIKTKVAGRGGTWFSPVIEYVNKDKYFRDALLIYFTDGYGELEIPRPKTYRNLWVVFGSAGNLSLKEPYGKVLTM